MALEEVAKMEEIGEGEMKQVEAGGREVLLANVGGKVYAIDDRCGHMGAPLHMGKLEDTIVQCPLHGARYDITTGKCVAQPKFSGLESKILSVTRYSKVVAAIKAYDRDTFKVVVEDGVIKLDVSKDGQVERKDG